MNWRLLAMAALLPWIGTAAWAATAETRFSQTLSRSGYVHWIELYDAKGDMIDPASPDAAPYSPVHTCGRCHDYEAIRHGYHFSTGQASGDSSRRGEPWVWTDDRTGTQIPLSARGWPGTYDPAGLGISEWDLVLKFGRHLAGGGPGEGPSAAAGSDQPAAAGDPPAAAAPKDPQAPAKAGEKAEAKTPAARWRLSGQLPIDCMICHSKDRSYSPEVWSDQIASQNFAWAPTAALGLGRVEGKVSALPDDFDAASADAKAKLPKTTYFPHRVSADKKVFFDVVRTPDDRACYYCHTTRFTGAEVAPEWTHDEDVHLRAGMTCSDCHRNGIEHQTVRGFEGETSPSGQPVHTLSCRGCHVDNDGGGRLGAPRAVHKGLPLVHFDKLACTACHSGPRPGAKPVQILTSMAHGLGLPAHHYGEKLPPAMVAPVYLQVGGALAPHRMVWPAFWGALKDGKISPLNPDKVYDALRRTLRVRRGSNFTEAVSEVKLTAADKAKALGQERAGVAENELTGDEKAKLEELTAAMAADAFRKKVNEALGELKKALPADGSEPVYVAGGRAYRAGADGAEAFEHGAAEPYAWRFAHDVRPARDATGAASCFECHADDSNYFAGVVTALGPAPDGQPPESTMRQLAGYDPTMHKAWNLSFQGRTAFKFFGFASLGVLALVLLAYGALAVMAIARFVRRL